MPTGNRSNLRSGIHALLLCILLLAVLVACNQTSAESTNPPVPDPTLAATEPEIPPAAPSDTPITASPVEPGNQSPEEIQAVLVKALMALNGRPNRMDVSTLLVDEGETRTNVIEFVPPDRKRIVSEEEGIEYIIVNNVVYARTETSGAWQQTSLPASTFMQENEVTEASVAETISDAKFLRSDTLDGKPVYVYSYHSSAGTSEVEIVNEIEIWIGALDGLPYKMFMDGQILSARTNPSTGKSELEAVPAQTTTQIEFDDNLTIEAPIP